MLALLLLFLPLGADDDVNLTDWWPSLTVPTANGILSFHPEAWDRSTITEFVSGKVFKRAELSFHVSAVARAGTGFLFGDQLGQFHLTNGTFTEIAKIDGVTRNGISSLSSKTDTTFIAINNRHQKLLIDTQNQCCRLLKSYSVDRLIEGKNVLYNSLLDSVYLTNKEGISIDWKYGITNIIPMDGERVAELRLTENNGALCLLTYRGGNRFGPTLEKSVRYFDAQTGKESARIPIATPNDLNSVAPADESRFGAFTSKGKSLFFEIFKESQGAYRSVYQRELEANNFCGKISGFFYSRPIYRFSSRYVGDNQFVINSHPRILVSNP